MLSLALLLLASTSGRAPDKPFSNDLIVEIPNGSFARAREVTRNLGRIVAKDSANMYVLRLDPRFSQQAAEKALEKRGLESIPWDFKSVDNRNLRSVQHHLEYLEAVEKLSGKKTEAADFYEALQSFLQYRVNKDGVINRDQYARAFRQQRNLAPANMQKLSPNIANAQWEYLGPHNLPPPVGQQQYFGSLAPIAGSVTCIAPDTKTAGTWYVGTGGGGLWKTTNAGGSWECITDKDPWLFCAVNCVTVDPSNSQVIYVGTGDHDGFFNVLTEGLMKSTDGGATWTNYGANEFGGQTVGAIIVDPRPGQSNNVTLTTGSGVANGQLWHSTDGGVTWKTTGVNTSWNSLIFTYTTNQYVAAGVAGGVILATSNDGVTWNYSYPPGLSVPELGASLAASRAGGMPNFETDFFLLCASNQLLLINGTTPIDLTTSAPFTDPYNWSQADYDYCLGDQFWLDASNQKHDILNLGLITMAQGILTVNADGTFSCDWTDIGQSFQPDAILHNDQHVATFIGANTVLIGNDAGVFKSLTDKSGNVTLSSVNSNLGTTQFYKIAPHPTDPGKILGGTQDNACPVAMGDLGNWECLGVGDGGACAWDVPHGLFYLMGNKRVFEYNGGARTEIEPNNNGVAAWGTRMAFIPPMVLSNKGQPMTCTNVLRKFDGTPGSWPEFGPDLTNGLKGWVSAMATAPSDDGILYTGSGTGQVWYTTDLGATSASWHKLDNPFSTFGTAIGSISVNPLDAHDVLVCAGGTSNTNPTTQPYLIRCADTTASNPQWTQFPIGGATGLPELPVNSIARLPSDPENTWFVGNDAGVVMTTDGGQTWQDATASLGLPTALVFDLEIGAGYLYAGTFGRGVWRIPLPNKAALKSLSIQVPSVYGGQTATGTVSIVTAQGATIAIPMSSSNPAVATAPGASIVAGQTSGNFDVDTYPVSTDTPVTIKATLNGASKSAILTVKAPILSAFKTNPNPVIGGLATTTTITLVSKAPAKGSTVALTASNGVAKPAATVTVPSGASSLTFTISTLAVTQTTGVTLTAKLNGSTLTNALTVIQSPLTAVALPASVVGGNAATGTIKLVSAAPTGGLPVTVSSNSTAAVPTAKTVTVLATKTSQIFSISTVGVAAPTSVTFTAKSELVTKTASLDVIPASVLSVSVSPTSVYGGQTAKATATLNGAAPSVGTTLSLSTSSTALATVPTSAKVAAGKNSVSFTVTTKGVASTTSVTVDAKFGSVTKGAALSLKPAILAGVAPTVSVVGGNPVTGTVTLTGSASPGGAVVTLTSSKTTVATVPASVTFAANAAAKSFTITTLGVASIQSSIVTAKYGSISKTCIVTAKPASLLSVTLSASSVKGGTSVTATVNLDGGAGPHGASVAISADSTDVLLPAASVLVAANAHKKAFTVKTKHPSASETVHIFAKFGSVTKSGALTITP